MNKANVPAFPVPLNPGEAFKFNGEVDGLTKRELFAAMAMQGLLANAERDAEAEGFARDAVRSADALLAELAKGGES